MTLDITWPKVHENLGKSRGSLCVHLCVCLCNYAYNICPPVYSLWLLKFDSQQRELISLLLQPHLQQALDKPTTTSRPLRSALRRASRISSVMKERAGLLNTPSWLSVGVKLTSLFLWRRVSTTELWLKPSEESSGRELNWSSKTSNAVEWANKT